MKKNQILVSFILLLATLNLNGFAQPAKYSPESIKKDLEYMRSTLEASNYDLYALTPKNVMDSMYNQIMGSINDSLTGLQVFRLFQPYVALANMSHCYMDYPWGKYFNNYITNEGSVFPLRLYFNDDKVYVRNNFSQNNLIEKNDEIVAFNGKPVTVMLDKTYKYIPGPSIYYKNSQIEQQEFARLFWFFFDEQNKFLLKIRKTDGKESDLTIASIPGLEFEEKLSKQERLFQVYREFNLKSNDIAYLHPGSFINLNVPYDPTNPEIFDNTEFCHFMDSAFNYFNKTNTKNLIIDLRYNPGGTNSFSDYMIAYFADKPFSFFSRFRIKTSEMTKECWKKIDTQEDKELKELILSHENGTFFDAPMTKYNPHPDSIRFKGKVYVIINRYSYSNSASVAAIVQDYGFGKIVGEETAEIVSSYGAMHPFQLPNTQWTVLYPKAFGTRPSGAGLQRGVIPDYEIDENIFTDNDEVLEYTIKLIENE